MVEYGFRTSVYIQEELIKQIDEAIIKWEGTFKSRSHFINCAISRELRRLKESKPEFEIE